MGETRELSLILSWLGIAYMDWHRVPEAIPLFDRALRIAEAVGDDRAVGYARVGLVFAHHLWNEDQPPDSAVELALPALPLLQRLDDKYPLLMCYTVLTIDRNQFGSMKQSLGWAQKLVDVGKNENYTPALATGLSLLAWTEVLSERYERAIDYADQALAQAKGIFERVSAMAVKASALTMSGHAQEGFDLLNEVHCIGYENGELGLMYGGDLGLGISMLLAGDMSAGMGTVRDFTERYRANGNRRLVAMGHFFQGEVYRQIATGGEKCRSAYC